MLNVRYPGVLVVLVLAALAGMPFAQAGSKRLAVVGDSLATGFYYGLRDAAAQRKFGRLLRLTKGATGLAPVRAYDWIAAARRLKKKHNPGLIVVCLGGNDRQDMFVDGRRLKRFTKRWWAEYRRRVDKFMRILAAGGARVYWVGLPTVRGKRMSRDYARLNAVYEDLAEARGITFIDTYAFSALGAGALSKRPLRDDDGVHFSAYGNMAVGRVILRAITRSLEASG